MYSINSNEEVPLSPEDEMVKRELDRLHLMLSNPLSIESLSMLVKDNVTGRIRLYLGTKRRIEYLIERKLATKFRPHNGGRRRKRGRPRKKRKYTRRTVEPKGDQET
jgi:hypothetical protein